MECMDWLAAQPWLERLSNDSATSHLQPLFCGVLECHVAAGDQYRRTASEREASVVLQFARTDELEVSLKLLKADENCTFRPPQTEASPYTDTELESTSGILLEKRETVFLLKTKQILRVERGESVLSCPLCSLSQDTTPLSEMNNTAFKETCVELDRLQALLQKLKLRDTSKQSKQPRLQLEDVEQLSKSQQEALRTWIQASQNMCQSAIAAKTASCCSDTSLLSRLLCSMAQQNRIAAGARERMVQRISPEDSSNIFHVKLSDFKNQSPLKEGFTSQTAAIWHSSADSVVTLSQKRQKVAKAREAALLSELFPDLSPKPSVSADLV